MRGIIASRSEVSPAAKTSSTICRSSSPRVVDEPTIVRSSSSVTSSREADGSPPSSRTRASVETPRNQISGLSTIAIAFTTGPSTIAKVSARCIASRLAVSSPITIEK